MRVGDAPADIHDIAGGDQRFFVLLSLSFTQGTVPDRRLYIWEVPTDPKAKPTSVTSIAPETDDIAWTRVLAVDPKGGVWVMLAGRQPGQHPWRARLIRVIPKGKEPVVLNAGGSLYPPTDFALGGVGYGTVLVSPSSMAGIAHIFFYNESNELSNGGLAGRIRARGREYPHMHFSGPFPASLDVSPQGTLLVTGLGGDIVDMWPKGLDDYRSFDGLGLISKETGDVAIWGAALTQEGLLVLSTSRGLYVLKSGER